MNVIPRDYWDLIILHPDCTAMALSGNKWYGTNQPFYQERVYSINWTLKLWKLAKRHTNFAALENPASVIFKYLINVQYIQPWQFGHPVNKRTGFARYNLPRLKPTNIIPADQRKDSIHKMPETYDRKRNRSVTYQGIASAIVDQWGALLK